MIEETANVVAATPDYIWVEARARSACSSCSTQDSCSTSVVAKWFGVPSQHLRLPNHVKAMVGDKVVIGVADRVMVAASLAGYLLPLLMMLGAAAAADSKGMNDIQQALVAMLGLMLGLFSAGVLTSHKRMQRFFQPKVLRKADDYTISTVEFKRFQGDTP